MIVASLLLIGVAVVLLVLGLLQPSSALLTGSIGVSLLAAVVLVIGARRSAAARTEAEATDDQPGSTEHRSDRDAGRATAAAVVSRHDTVVLGTRTRAGRDADESSAQWPEPTDEPSGRQPPDVSPPQRDYAVAVAPGGSATAAAAEPDPAAEGPHGRVPVAIPQQGAPAAERTIQQSDVLERPLEPPPRHDHSSGHLHEQADDQWDPPDEPAAQQVSPADAVRVGQLGTEVLVVDGRPRYHLPGCVHLLGRECEPLPVSEAAELGFTPCSLCEPDSALLADARRV